MYSLYIFFFSQIQASKIILFTNKYYPEDIYLFILKNHDCLTDLVSFPPEQTILPQYIFCFVTCLSWIQQFELKALAE